MHWYICLMETLLDIGGHDWYGDDEMFRWYGGPVEECQQCGIVVCLESRRQVRKPIFENI